MSHSAAKRLWREYRDITHPKTGLKQIRVEIDDDNIFLWQVALIVIDPESSYKGGYLKGQIKFPVNYPFAPPVFKFTPSIYHPNVYIDGRVCISILHEAGDEQSDELDSETWSPAQSVESVLISIMSLLEDPNIASPANVEAAISYRKHKLDYKQRVLKDVARSKNGIPEGFVMPELEDLKSNVVSVEQHDDEDWWEDNYYDDDIDDDEVDDDESDDDEGDDDEGEEKGLQEENEMNED